MPRGEVGVSLSEEDLSAAEAEIGVSSAEEEDLSAAEAEIGVSSAEEDLSAAEADVFSTDTLAFLLLRGGSVSPGRRGELERLHCDRAGERLNI